VTLKYAKNAFAAGAPLQTPLGSSRRSRRPPSRSHLSRRLRRLHSRAFGFTGFWQIEHWYGRLTL